MRLCCGRITRGLAILDDTLFLAAADAHLIAIDAKTGRPIWNRIVASGFGYSMTTAPLVIKDKVIAGTAGGEFGIRGLIGAGVSHAPECEIGFESKDPYSSIHRHAPNHYPMSRVRVPLVTALC